MIKEVFKYLFLLLVLLLLQFFVFNNINFKGFVNPYVYVMFILVLPFSLKNWQILLIGFITGLFIDMFMNTLGLHAAATLMLAYMRHIVILRFTNRVDIPRFTAPGISVGLGWFLRYVFILVLIHHCVLFFMEAFTFHHFFFTLVRVLLSTLLTSIFIVFIELLHTKRA